MRWAWSTTDLAGTANGVIVPRVAVIDRWLNAATTCTLELEPEQARTVAHGALLKGWRQPDAGGDRVLRFSGRVADTSAAEDDSSSSVVAMVGDAFHGLTSRFLPDGAAIAAPGGVVGQTPRELVSAAVQSLEGTVAPGVYAPTTGLYVPLTGSSGPLRDRTYAPGKNVAELITQLAEVDDGFWFTIDPYEGTLYDTALFSQITILYPESGGESGVSLERGAGTLGNLSGVEVSRMPPVNRVTARGAEDADTTPSVVVSDVASIVAYGMHEAVVSLPDVFDTATLEQHARDALRPEPVTTMALIPAPVLGPSPWDDIDVGELLTVRLAGASVQLQGVFSCRCTGMQVTVDSSGLESITGLTVEVR